MNVGIDTPVLCKEGVDRDGVRPDAILSFSSLTIIGLASSEGSKVPVTLVRSVSFPAHRYTNGESQCTELDSDGWESLPLPVGKPHLEIKLGRCLGTGRIGSVYTARVLRVLDRPGGTPILNPPIDVSTKLVVKVVKPTNCRSLARETWFYERLSEAEGYQGAVVPLCYGFYTTSTASIESPSSRPVRINAWIDKKGKHVPLDLSKSREFGDGLPDEVLYNEDYYVDQRTCRKDSPWCNWRPDPSNPLLGVLVLERLGKTYSREDFDNAPRSRKDLADLIDDLSSASIVHDDFKFNNVVRSRTQVVCQRHGYAHAWRVIDFDRSSKWGKTVQEDNTILPRFYREQFATKDPIFFLGTPEGYDECL
ncbi:hypothetical protein Hypma_006382 [Hypsizygus marmoreus]|uniref:Protein kinase domain-containing protein n=1 Tax=Hypsizygus marmoreus TaxID=39966 RepID=A0A369JWE0_HYPMA|nr:hypothetical protein Hypma_006382 [Hypsizygus marmoreus]